MPKVTFFILIDVHLSLSAYFCIELFWTFLIFFNFSTGWCGALRGLDVGIYPGCKGRCYYRYDCERTYHSFECHYILLFPMLSYHIKSCNIIFNLILSNYYWLFLLSRFLLNFLYIILNIFLHKLLKSILFTVWSKISVYLASTTLFLLLYLPPIAN